ncbi:MAG: polysaccharide biosynthesis transport protein, partial [Candidatus Eremiobacteraeota bacterium]|nr:polysaccharide biosynthesis transport protein [Candidatus Eremiobacteraeota bacterium]
MYEPQRLPGNSIPLATPVSSHRATEVDPVAMWHSFVGTLSRRRMLFATVVLGVIIAVAVVTLLTPKRYRTDVKMIAGNPNSVAQNPQGSQTGLPVLNALLLANAAQSAETYAELIGESPVVEKVIRDLNLNTDVRTLQSAVRVKPVTNTNIISLQVTWNDPDTSAKIANDFATVFVGRQAELVAGQANGALDFLGKQLPQAREHLAKAEEAVSRYETSHNIADLGTQTTTTVAAAANIDAKINAIQLEKQQADAQIASYSRQLAGMNSTSGGGSSVAQNPVIPQLRGQLAQLKIQLGSAQQQLTDSHPTVINLKQQISDLNAELKRQPPTIVATT